MSKLSEKGFRKDRFHRDARKQGLVARSAFKLEAIDQKAKLFSRGQRVLDLGCAPGSWLQYAAKQVGPSGYLVGIDRVPIELSMPNLRTEVGNVFDVQIEVLVGNLGGFDVVMSDMAPDTSGIRSLDQDRSEVLFEQALNIAGQVLFPGGHFVGKLFQGGGFQRITKACRQDFEKVRNVKPPASRRASIEQYIVCTGFRETTAKTDTPAVDG